MVSVDNLVTLRRLTYAIMLHRGISQLQAVRAVGDILNFDSYRISIYSISTTCAEKIIGEDRWEVGANFWNAQAMTNDGKPIPIKYRIKLGFDEDREIDGIGIQHQQAMIHGKFSSSEELNIFIERGESEMRKNLLISTYEAIDYLIEENKKTSARAYNEKFNASNRALHATGLMKAAIQVQKKYWEDPDSTPKQEVIISEIREEYGFTEAEAKAVERVACPKKRSK